MSSRLSRAARRDRRRKFGVIRQPDGSIQDKTPIQKAEDASIVAVQARERVFGMSSIAARHVEAGSAIGRLRQCRLVSAAQFEAGNRYVQVQLAFRRAIMAKMPRSASDYSGSGGYDASDGDEPDYVAEYMEAVERWQVTKSAILAEGALCWTAIDLWCRDIEAWNRIGDLRIGLNALVRLWKIR